MTEEAITSDATIRLAKSIFFFTAFTPNLEVEKIFSTIHQSE